MREWTCACGEKTSETHWATSEDGTMFHVGPTDDQTLVNRWPNQKKENDVEVQDASC